MKRNCIYVAVLAALAAAGADARITKVTIDSRATAFGGYAWPGVGQYEKITGRRTASSTRTTAQRRHHRHQARAAQRQRQGRVLAQLLHPEADRPSKGNHKVVYDAVNRGSKTFSVLNRG
jgi:hypothetical protein